MDQQLSSSEVSTPDQPPHILIPGHNPHILIPYQPPHPDHPVNYTVDIEWYPILFPAIRHLGSSEDRFQITSPFLGLVCSVKLCLLNYCY